jgi:hypothetical protein
MARYDGIADSEHFEEDGEDDYPYLVALVARR